MTAASVIIERGGVLYAFAQFFMPANRLETAQAVDGVPYDIFVKQGIVKLDVYKRQPSSATSIPSVR